MSLEDKREEERPISPEVLEAAEDKASRHAQRLAKVWEDLQTLFKMLKGQIKGEVRLPKSVAFGAAAAILYFLNPIDAVPDAVPIAGLLDDVAVIGAVVMSLKQWIDKFRSGELNKRVGIDA